jgi:phenylalanyl-tRNA synthetase alpha chain
VYQNGRWAEVWECGLAHRNVLAAAGLHGCGGLALGMGLDRLLMLVKHIPDIRLLRSGDPRITCQMLDLAKYQHVSSMPPITRDLPSPSPRPTTRKLSATESAMPSAPTRVASRRSG